MDDNGHDGREAINVRSRRPADIPALVDVLWAQQTTSQYPFRRPLPVPVEQFMHADDAVAAWTAELEGRPVGHVCRVRPPHHDLPDAAEMNRACARAHRCDVDQLAWICTLFVGLQGRGQGIGRRLLSAVVEDIHAVGLHPVP
jgi:GNAT superfamily N-acetyltransferase